MKLLRAVATLGPIGYLPMPGTCATAATIIALYFGGFSSYPCTAQLIGTIVAYLGSVSLISAILPAYESNDPSEIVLDEVVGTVATFCCVPMTWQTILLGFVLFRLLDIAKPFGIRKLEQAPAGWGVVNDDLVAGIVSCLLLHGIAWLTTAI